MNKKNATAWTETGRGERLARLMAAFLAGAANGKDIGAVNDAMRHVNALNAKAVSEGGDAVTWRTNIAWDGTRFTAYDLRRIAKMEAVLVIDLDKEAVNP
jgi:hypothetical protein